jgi:O-antigen ligase
VRNAVRGWRSARWLAQPPALATADAGTHVPFWGLQQEPLKIGLGLAGLTFYLWIIHSYKLPAGDIAVLALVVGTLTRGARIRLPGPIMVFAAFIAWSAITIAVSANVDTSTDALTGLIKLWIISFCIVNVVRTPAEFRYLTITWLALFALYPIRGALHTQFICHCAHMGRVSWNFAFSNPNDLAALCLLPMSIAAGLSTMERNKLFRWAAAAGIGVMALVILLTQSRGAMLALGLAVILLPVFSRRGIRDVLAIAALVGLGAIFAPRNVWERLAGLTNASVDAGMAEVDPEGSAQARWGIWQIAIGQIQDHPLTGIGIGMMPETNMIIARRDQLDWGVRGLKDTHSTYLRIGAETGYTGLLLYLTMWTLVFLGLRRASRASRSRQFEHRFLGFLQIGTIAFMMASIFGTYVFMSFTSLSVAYLWLAGEIMKGSAWYVPPKLAGGQAASAVPATVGRRSRA